MWLPRAAEPVPDLLGHPEGQKAPPEYRRVAQHRLQPTTSLLPQRALMGATATIFHGLCLWHGTKTVPLVTPKNGSNSALHSPFRNGGESLDRRHVSGTPIRLTARPRPERPGADRSLHASTGHSHNQRPNLDEITPGWADPSKHPGESYHQRINFANSEPRGGTKL